MLFNYIKIGIRGLRKHRYYSLINILGLSIGLSAFFLMMTYVVDEFSFDRYHQNADRIYRIVLKRSYPTHTTSYTVVPVTLVEILEEELGEMIEKQTHFVYEEINEPVHAIVDGDTMNLVEVHRLIHSDTNFFQVFNIPIIKQLPDTVPREENHIIITESNAKKLFGEVEALGKKVYNGQSELLVTGICRDVPRNTHFSFDAVMPLPEKVRMENNNFLMFSTLHYVRLKEGVSPLVFEKQIEALVPKYAAPQVQKMMGISYEEYLKAGNNYEYFLQPITNIHVKSDLELEMSENNDVKILYVFTVVSFIILLIACINYMNLTTARATVREKEVGIRKSLGSDRPSIVMRFLMESLIISLISLFVCFVFVIVLMPAFSHLMGSTVTFEFNKNVWVSSAALVGFISIMGGLYPAIIMSRYNPIRVISKKTFRISGQYTRRFLVVFQFSVSITLIAGALIALKQLSYMSNKDMGFNDSGIYVLNQIKDRTADLVSLQTEMLKLEHVENVAMVSSLPGQETFFGSFYQTKEGEKVLTSKSMFADEGFVNTFEIEVSRGRNFDPELDDSTSILLNQSAVDALELENPIGRTILAPSDKHVKMVTFKVVGVVKDFHFQSFHYGLTPLVIQYSKSNGRLLAVKLQNGYEENALKEVEATWNKVAQNDHYTVENLEHSLRELYKEDTRRGVIVTIFAILATVLASIGLLGLAAFTTQRRTKEIGIRKVLGASEQKIVYMLSAEFARYVIIAFLCSIPVTWFVMDKWLAEFAYHIGINFWMLILSGIFSLLLAWITVGYLSLKTALSNPVLSLRYE